MPFRFVSRGALAATTLAATLLAAPVAAHASTWPSAPSSDRLISAGPTGFTVTQRRADVVSRYVLWTSTVKRDLFYLNLVQANLRPATLHARLSASPTISMSGLAYTTKTYYWRLETRNAGHRRVSPVIHEMGLRPSNPYALAFHQDSRGAYLQWSAGSATGFNVRQASDPSMTSDVHSFWIRGNTHQFTPYLLTRGHTYYWRIRAVNHHSLSAFSGQAQGVASYRTQGVRAMTYNILTKQSDGIPAKGGTIAPWSLRRLSAAALINSVRPDVVGVQEGFAWVGADRGVRQVDSLCSALRALGNPWVVARTEVPYPQRGWRRYGNYVLYNSAHYQAVGAAGHWLIGGREAAYQELRNRTTGATFLFVTTHLTQPGGRSYDLQRQSETLAMVQAAQAQAARDGVPVVYSGDFNSNPEQTTFDGPAAVMHDASIADARLRAQRRHNESYDSYNNYVPWRFRYSLFLDYIWAPPGVSVSTWGVALPLSSSGAVGTIGSDHNPVYADLAFPYRIGTEGGSAQPWLTAPTAR